MKKFITLLLAFVMAFATLSFTACGKNDENTLYIKVMLAGYGRAWADELGELFEEKFPGKKVDVDTLVKDSEQIVNEVMSGAGKYDLIFVESMVETKYNTPIVAKNGTRYEHPFADISDIYDELVPGENIKLKDKMLEQVYNLVTVKNDDGTETQYSIPWMKSLNGFIINNKVLQRNGYTIEKFPNTTDEMFELFDDLVENTNIVPLTYSKSASYIDQVYEAWQFQYYGTDVMKLYYQGYNMDDFNDYNLTIDAGKETGRYQPEIFYTIGQEEALKIYERLATPENNYVGKTQTQKDVTSLDFTAVQNKFLEPANNILMMANGLWLEREMEANYTADEVDVEYVKTPVVSALGKKLGITDAVLSEIIDYVDAGMTGTAPVFTTTKTQYTPEQIIAIVADARGINTSAFNFNSVISAYSTKIEMAKDYLQLMATDEGLEIMYDACGGSAPFNYSIDKLDNLYAQGKLSKFTYSGNKMILQGKYNFDARCDLFTKNGLYNFQMYSKSFLSCFASLELADRVSAEDICVQNYEYCQQMMDTWLRTAGIEI